VGSKGLDGLQCPITKRIIGLPLTDEELASIEYLRKPFGSGYRHVLRSYTSSSYRAVATGQDLGHRRNPAEAALLYHMSSSEAKPKPMVYSDKVLKPAENITSLYYHDVSEEDIVELEYLKSSRNIHGYRNVTQMFSTGRYASNVIVDKRNIYLGSFKTVVEAAMALHLFFQTGRVIRNLTPADSMTKFVLTDVELKLLKLSNKNQFGFLGVGFNKNKFTATAKEYKTQLALGRYLTAQEAAWAVYLFYEYGIKYKDIMLLARTGELYPSDDAFSRAFPRPLFTIEELCGNQI